MAKQPNWTRSENELLRKLYNDGISDIEIASQLKRSIEAIKIHRGRLKLVQSPVWNDEKIREEILKCMDQLLIDRMPTASELTGIGRQDLHNKICKTKKYSGWANELNLKTTDCETRTGQRSEERIQRLMERKGFEIKRMSTKFPYDLLVNDCVKVDVKCAKPNFHNHSRSHTFGINKTNPTCDVYVIAAINEQGWFERILVVPSHFIRMKTLNIGEDSKWNHFLGKWDIIRKYSEFYKNVM